MAQRRRVVGDPDAGAPPLGDRSIEPLMILGRRRPRIVLTPGASSPRPVQQQARHVLWVRGGKEQAHRPRLVHREDVRRGRPDGGHHGSHVVDAFLQRRHLAWRKSIGQANPSLVEQDQPAELGQPCGEVAEADVFPHDIEMSEPPGDAHHIGRPVTQRLIGDVQPVRVRVPCPRRHSHCLILSRRDAVHFWEPPAPRRIPVPRADVDGGAHSSRRPIADRTNHDALSSGSGTHRRHRGRGPPHAQSRPTQLAACVSTQNATGGRRGRPCSTTRAVGCGRGIRAHGSPNRMSRCLGDAAREGGGAF
jgi:hypothetical protein